MGNDFYWKYSGNVSSIKVTMRWKHKLSCICDPDRTLGFHRIQISCFK